MRACRRPRDIPASACDKVPLLAPQASTITVSSNSSVVQANGTAEIRATVLEPSGTAVQNGTTVTFTTTLGALSPAEARTTQWCGDGAVRREWSIRNRRSEGPLRWRSISDAELPVGRRGKPPQCGVQVRQLSSAGGTSTITATVVDASSNPLRGVSVTFATNAGTLTSTVVNTDASGTATTALSTVPRLPSL